MRRKNDTNYVDIICSVCGNVSLFQRTPTKKITIFTKTSSWCFKCKSITTHYILNDFDFAYHRLKILNELTEDEKAVLELIERRNEKKLIKKYDE